MVTPMPTVTPLMAAMNGFGKVTKLEIRRACGEGPVMSAGPDRKSLRSLPAQKLSPEPVTTTACTSSLAAACSKASEKAPYISDVRAFFFSGRFN